MQYNLYGNLTGTVTTGTAGTVMAVPLSQL